MPLTMQITNVGRAALVNATNTGTDPVTIAEFGISDVAIVPDGSEVALPGEFKRVSTLSGDIVDDDTIHLIVRDNSADAYDMLSWGLYLADGTLFAVFGQATPIMSKTAQSLMLMAIDVRFADIDAAALTFGDTNFLNPPATTEVQGVVELATSPESQAGADTVRVPSVKAMYDAVFAWLDARFGVNNALVWNPNNDGAGSGLDADLLDGQQGSYYSNIVARLGFTPVNRAGDTMAGPLIIPRLTLQSAANVFEFHETETGKHWFQVGDGTTFRISEDTTATVNDRLIIYQGAGIFSLTGTDPKWNGLKVWHAANDGAASGLDADLLDGQEGSYYLAASAFNAAAIKALLLTVDGAGSGVDADLLDGQQGSYYLPAGNYTAADIRAKLLTVDGAGSGVDADLLDGQQGSYYSDVVARLGYTPLNKAGDTLSGRLALSPGGFRVATKDDITVRVDSGFWETSTATQAEGWPLNTNQWFHLLSSTHSSDSNYYSMQFAGSFYNSADIFYRATSNNGSAPWNRLWTSGNDGAGSGLDADLLDGQQGSYYTDIIARLGYTPLDTTNYTAADIRAKLLTVDGAGSGVDADLLDGQQGSYYLPAGNYTAADIRTKLLTVDGAASGIDADMLDGQHGSWYADITARLGFAPVQQGTGIGQGGNAVKIGWTGTRLKATVDSTDQGNFVFDSNIADVWRASNDGAGSGLDADLLDGQQGSYYTDIIARLGYTPLNVTSYTAADIRAKLLTVDGAGSGVDADLLDGFQGADFLRAISTSFSEQGYVQLSNGLILQWGTAAGTYAANTDVQVTFPIQFPNQVLHVSGGNGDVLAQGDAVVGINYTTAPNLSRFFFRTNKTGQNRCNWWAVGR